MIKGIGKIKKKIMRINEMSKLKFQKELLCESGFEIYLLQLSFEL